MTDQNAQEPTMEEILASIRRIISEDDAPAETPPAPAPAPEPEPAPVAFAPEPEPAPAPQPAEDVLELTQRYEPPVEEVIGDLDVSTAAEPEPEPFPAVVAEPAPAPEPAPVAETGLVGESTAATAASAFAGLSAALKKPEPAAELPIATSQTIDELVRGLLRPLLKDWLDANLPGIVEEAVRKEVERIARNVG